MITAVTRMTSVNTLIDKTELRLKSCPIGDEHNVIIL